MATISLIGTPVPLSLLQAVKRVSGDRHDHVAQVALSFVAVYHGGGPARDGRLLAQGVD